MVYKQRRSARNHSRAGFTLLEMALVTVIIGIMAWIFMSFMEDYIGREKIEEGRRNAELAVEQVQGFLIGNTGKLPDPRTGNLLPLDIANHKDPWGNELRYWRADELDGKAVDDVDSTQMFIRYFANASDLASLSSPTKTISNVAYVVISHGKDGAQSFTQTTGSIYINMLEDGVSTGDGGSFDDILQYKTLPQVRTVFSATGLTGANQVDNPDVSQEAAMSLKGGETGTGVDLSTYVTAGTDVGIVTNTGVGSGQALSLGGGEDDIVNLNENTDDFQFATYTIMCWFKTDADYDASEAEAFGVITARAKSSSDRTWWLTIWGGGYDDQNRSGAQANPRDTLSGDLALKASTTAEDYIIFTHDEPQTRYDDNQWHFVAATIRESGSGYEAELYVDGAVKDTQTHTRPPETGSGYDLYIGSGSTTNNNYSDNRRFEGLIDEFYIYGSETEDQSLTTAQIDAYYQASKSSFGY